MAKKHFWKEIFKQQKVAGWCGPAVIQMALAAAGIKKSQDEIAKDVFLPWWGTPNQIILTYLSQFFKDLGTKTKATLLELKNHLKKGHIVIVNWWDDYDKANPDGHYSLVINYNSHKRKLTLADPASDGGIWQIEEEEFKKRWFDYLDVQKKNRLHHWFLWLNPKSKIQT